MDRLLSQWDAVAFSVFTYAAIAAGSTYTVATVSPSYWYCFAVISFACADCWNAAQCSVAIAKCYWLSTVGCAIGVVYALVNQWAVVCALYGVWLVVRCIALCYLDEQQPYIHNGIWSGVALAYSYASICATLYYAIDPARSEWLSFAVIGVGFPLSSLFSVDSACHWLPNSTDARWTGFQLLHGISAKLLYYQYSDLVLLITVYVVGMLIKCMYFHRRPASLHPFTCVIGFIEHATALTAIHVTKTADQSLILPKAMIGLLSEFLLQAALEHIHPRPLTWPTTHTLVHLWGGTISVSSLWFMVVCVRRLG